MFDALPDGEKPGMGVIPGLDGKKAHLVLTVLIPLDGTTLLPPAIFDALPDAALFHAEFFRRDDFKNMKLSTGAIKVVDRAIVASERKEKESGEHRRDM